MVNSIVVPDLAKIRHMTARMLGTYSPIDGNTTLHYFSNNISLSAATVLADFDEVSFLGYSPFLLTGAVNLGIVTGDWDQWQWPTSVTEATSDVDLPVTAYGYWCTSNDDGALLWCQSFDVPFTWAFSGDYFTFQPALAGGQLTV